MTMNLRIRFIRKPKPTAETLIADMNTVKSVCCSLYEMLGTGVNEQNVRGYPPFGCALATV